MRLILVLLILLVVLPVCFSQSKVIVEEVTENVGEAEALTVGSGSNDKIYVYGNGLIASIGDVINYYHDNIVGSNVVITDSNGNVVYEGDFLPFGYGFSSVGENDYGFSNKELDDTGLNYFVARYYDSKLGRFLQRDLKFKPDFTPYHYTKNNPFKFIDPSGNQEVPSHFLNEKINDDLILEYMDYTINSVLNQGFFSESVIPYYDPSNIKLSNKFAVSLWGTFYLNKQTFKSELENVRHANMVRLAGGPLNPEKKVGSLTAHSIVHEFTHILTNEGRIDTQEAKDIFDQYNSDVPEDYKEFFDALESRLDQSSYVDDKIIEMIGVGHPYTKEKIAFTVEIIYESSFESDKLMNIPPEILELFDPILAD